MPSSAARKKPLREPCSEIDFVHDVPLQSFDLQVGEVAPGADREQTQCLTVG